jgi:tRNA(His) 5'-end guanylyltransferase
MVDTAKYLVEKTHAVVGYTQSDEISLFWYNSDPLGESSYMFDGKFQKLTSVLASMASAFFTKNLSRIPEKQHEIAVFDCRVWNVSDRRDVYLNFLWRQDDAIKNSISMAAQAHFSHKALHGVGSEAKKQMLHDINRPWEHEPTFFKMGTFVKRVTEEVALTVDQRMNIPEKHRPPAGMLVARSTVKDIGLGYIKNDPVAKELFGISE